MRTHTWRVSALLAGSGFCALVYQIGWLREFRLIFGASTAASAAVLAIFIGGLGLGGLLLGARADRAERPILYYSRLEAIIAVSAAISPLLLALVRQVYILGGGTPRLGVFVGSAIRLVLSALVLAVPTIAMGGTLPAAARGVTSQSDTRRRDVAALYGMNTLGAVVGSLVATFAWLELFGTRTTIWLAAAINLLVAIIARQIDRTMAESGAESAEQAGPVEAADEAVSATLQATLGAPALPVPRAFLLIASGVVGFAFFLMELVWYRMLGPLLGGTVFTFGLILGVALAGVGIGGIVYAVVGKGRQATLAGFALTCLLEAATMAIGYGLGDRLALLTFLLRPAGAIGFSTQVAGWTLVAMIVILLPALVAGYQFPLLIALFGQGRDRLGNQIGLAYAANTFGAIVGSLAGGFGLMPWLSAPGTWRFAALTLVGLALAAIAIDVARGARRAFAVQLALTAATLVLLVAVGPTAAWRHSGVGLGRAALSLDSPNGYTAWQRGVRRQVQWEGDGTESSVALTSQQTGYAFIVNGKSDGSARGDAGTQVMSGLLGAIVNPRVRTSLVIGLGTGSTAGWLGAVPAMERVDVVELEPLILNVARDCRAVNRDVLANPKVHIQIADARELLLTTRNRYDLIASEPSNPFRAGVASLFTREYYAAASDRLTDDGLFVQWVQSYEIDASTFKTILATFASIFPHVEVWQTRPGDLMLIGARNGRTYLAAKLAARIQEEPFKSALRDAWRAVTVEGLLAHFVASNTTVRTLVAQPGILFNTDDRNVVEFGLARSAGFPISPYAALRAFAQSTGGARPPIDEAAINWDRVQTEWVTLHAPDEVFSGVTATGPPGERSRQAAIILYYRDNNRRAALTDWRQQSEPPTGPVDLAMLADILAEDGSDEALPYIEALRAYQPVEADAALATLYMRQRKDEAEAAVLESAMTRLRTDPWPIYRFTTKIIALANELALRNRAMAPRMLKALTPPFAVLAAQDQRLTTAAFLTRLGDFPGTCRDAVSALEPHVPWTADFLLLRYDCYTAAGDRRAAAAAADLETFANREPIPLVRPLSGGQ